MDLKGGCLQHHIHLRGFFFGEKNIYEWPRLYLHRHKYVEVNS